MNYILVMSLSGSCLYFLHLILKKSIGQHLQKRWEYILLKIDLLYFLIPLPFLKKYLIDIGSAVFRYVPLEKGYYDTKYVVIHEGHKAYLNDAFQIQIIIGGVWILGILVVFTINILKYIQSRKRILRSSVRFDNEASAAQLLSLLKIEYGIRRPVTVLLCNENIPSCTFGIWKPIIIVNRKALQTNLEFVLRHELVHIKKYDCFFQILNYLICMLHWYNPIAFLLRKELNQICEITCDETVVKKMTSEQCAAYAKLLISQSRSQNSNKNVKWSRALSNEGKRIEERIIFIMKNRKTTKKRNSILSAAIVGIVTLSCSITALAYDDITPIESAWNASTEEVEIWSSDETTFYLPGYDKDTNIIDEFIYDEQFIDPAGNVFPVENAPSTYASCSHSYVDGIISSHSKVSGTKKCIVRKYDGKRCSKCGTLYRISLIAEYTYNPCPH